MPGLDPTDPPADFVMMIVERSFPGGDTVPLTGSTEIDLAFARCGWALQVIRDEANADGTLEAVAAAVEVLNADLNDLNALVAGPS
jgi:hypothetical protein